MSKLIDPQRPVFSPIPARAAIWAQSYRPGHPSHRHFSSGISPEPNEERPARGGLGVGLRGKPCEGFRHVHNRLAAHVVDRRKTRKPTCEFLASIGIVELHIPTDLTRMSGLR